MVIGPFLGLTTCSPAVESGGVGEEPLCQGARAGLEGSRGEEGEGARAGLGQGLGAGRGLGVVEGTRGPSGLLSTLGPASLVLVPRVSEPPLSLPVILAVPPLSSHCTRAAVILLRVLGLRRSCQADPAGPLPSSHQPSPSLPPGQCQWPWFPTGQRLRTLLALPSLAPS